LQTLDDWEQRFRELFPNGLTQEEIDEANAVIWKHTYPTKEMAEDDEEETKAA
jgi:hypothetical protein